MTSQLNSTVEAEDNAAERDTAQELNLFTPYAAGPANLWLSRWIYRGVHFVANNDLIADVVSLVPVKWDVTPIGESLETLGVLHYGRWVRVDRLPRISCEQPKEDRNWSLIVFLSVFDADWRRYVGLFVESAGNGLRWLWGKTPGWVKPEDGFEAFLDRVNRFVVPSHHFYAAYPELSSASIKAALAVDRELRSFLAAPGRTDEAPEAWYLEYRALLGRVQRNLGAVHSWSDLDVWQGVGEGPPSEEPKPWLRTAFELARDRPDRSEHTPLTVLIPMPKDKVGLVRDLVCALDQGSFATIPGTHFARLAVLDHIDRGMDPGASTRSTRPGLRRARTSPYLGFLAGSPEPKPPWELRSGYLLFAADVDGTAKEYLTDLYYALLLGNDLTAVFAECYGFEESVSDAEAFVDWVLQCSFPEAVGFADYPASSLWDVYRALFTHHRFTGFVFEHWEKGKDDATELQRAFRGAVAPTVADHLPVRPDL